MLKINRHFRPSVSIPPINRGKLIIGVGRCGFQPDRIQSNPVGAVCNRTGLKCLINFKIHYRYDDLPPQMHWDEAPTMLQHFGPLLNNLHDPIKELPLGAIKAGIE